ncbi:MAG: CDP-diacylglycerol--glycerol-3-phosphate 3-phosphatidyltransferase [Mariprofundaceae bacterium]
MQLTVSNQLTLARIALIPVFAAAFYLPGITGYLLATMFFSLAAITDWLDGYLARKRGEVTAFGRFLDPVADKLLVATALVLLVEADRAPALLSAIIVGREITIGALREWLAQHNSIVHVSLLGKWKTGVQMAAIITLLLNITMIGINMHLAGIILLWIASILTLWSGYEYIRDSWDELMSGASQKDSD